MEMYRISERDRRTATRCVQGTKIPIAGPSVQPIAQTSTFVFENQKEMLRAVTGKSEKNVYTRWTNPTTVNAQNKISALEGTDSTLLLSSGMAAISSTVMGLAKKGDRILSSDSIYGGTLHLFEDILPRNGIEVDFVEQNQFIDAIEDSKSEHRLCFFETPTNPALRLMDIKSVAEASRSAGLTSVIDNTFATPINQHPHQLGIDIVIHSATKYLGGHSDLIAGSVSGLTQQIGKIDNAARLLGGTIDPFASFLLERGIKTLAVRMEKHNSNAAFLAEELSRDSRIRRVYYPGLTSHPQHDIAKKQMDGFGGMLTIEIDGDLKATEIFVDSMELFLNAVSLGGVESLASIPVLTTHYGIDEGILREMNVSNSTVRLSVGIEDPNDLLYDIKNALDMAVQ
ncbi:aminotransferase class I/II-fold pyridoxal phosphate-dependent enzyme [Candidatus Thorarchaeota archaeon]|nr:MAG: aminotransferase class I/II-fold pyridoxal phosphate-dependent enzyme [Candidatus Thorarchaeota archaeon]